MTLVKEHHTAKGKISASKHEFRSNSLRFLHPALSLANIWLRHHDQTSIIRVEKPCCYVFVRITSFTSHTHHSWLMVSCRRADLYADFLQTLLFSNVFLFLMSVKLATEITELMVSVLCYKITRASCEWLPETWRRIWDDLNNSFANAGDTVVAVLSPWLISHAAQICHGWSQLWTFCHLALLHCFCICWQSWRWDQPLNDEINLPGPRGVSCLQWRRAASFQDIFTTLQ